MPTPAQLHMRTNVRFPDPWNRSCGPMCEPEVRL
jgi:hypothetical protein